MICTTNHPNKACTVFVSHLMTRGTRRECFVTYLNVERVWPVRRAAVMFAEKHTVPR